MVKRVLFAASYPDQPIGYSKIANIISNSLASNDDIELYYFGFSNNETTKVNRHINPNIKLIDVAIQEVNHGEPGELYGVNIVNDYIKHVEPDYLFIYNDCIVTCRLFNSINKVWNCKKSRPFKTIVYLDLVYDFQCPEFLQFIYDNSDKVLLFSDHWKKNYKATLNRYGEEYDTKVSVMYHGFNIDLFPRLDPIYCRNKLGLKDDDFIVVNLNRNNYRKALDITFTSFVLFLRNNNYNRRLKLLVTNKTDSKSGYNFNRSIEIACKSFDIPTETINTILNNHIIMLQSETLEDDVINFVYNASDVGINTCIGEGFGLCNMEQAILGKPQIVSRVGALHDIFEDYLEEATIKPKSSFQISTIADEHTGVGYIISPEDVANKLQDVYDNYPKYKSLYDSDISPKLLRKFNWYNILNQLNLLFN